LLCRKDVDARHKAGHDEREAEHFNVMAGFIPAIHALLAGKREERRGCPA